MLNHQGQIRSLIMNKTLRSAVWTASGKGYLRQELQSGLPSLFEVQEDKVHCQIRIRPGQSGLAGVVKEKLTHLDAL